MLSTRKQRDALALPPVKTDLYTYGVILCTLLSNLFALLMGKGRGILILACQLEMA